MRFFLEFAILSITILIITSLFGVLLNFFGKFLFGLKNRHIFVKEFETVQKNWKKTGGKSKT